jgi:glucosamine-6-phosphate deaminase
MNWQKTKNYDAMSHCAAEIIYGAIAKASERGKRFNLGMATGNTMLELYRILAEALNNNDIKLEQLHTYNLDEYLSNDGNVVSESHPLSYRKYMRDNFFSRLKPELGFSEEQIHFPEPADPARFDRELEETGGIDLQLLGIGFNGHIAFNEPENAASASIEEFAERPSRIIELMPLTLETNAKLTAGGKLGDVPTKAVTMGMKPILAAKEILLLACFEEQEEALGKMRKIKPTPELPASYLLRHPSATVIYTGDKICLD